MLRVLIQADRVRVWLNPSFADITGAHVPPADEAHPPHTPAAIADAKSTAAAKAGLAAHVSTGQWRIDYASALPAALFVGA